MDKIMRIVFLSVLIICMLAMPAMANYDSNGWPVETRVNGTVNGGVFHDSIGWTEETTQTLDTDVPNGTVKYAYLYTGVWGNGVSSKGWVNVTFNGDCTSNKLGPIYLEGGIDSNDNVWCTGLGKHWFWYNVTNLVNAGQTNTATTTEINGTLDGRVYGIVLVVVYEGGDDPKQIQYWINDGSKALNNDNPSGTTNFVGTVSTDNIAMANLTMVHLTGYKPICDECMKFNGNILNTSGVNTNSFDMHTWNVTNYMEASGNDAWFSRGSDPSVNICNAILTVEYAPDLNVTDVLVNPGDTRYEGIVRVYVNQNNNISAVVQNNGPVDVTGDFDVCFEADGVKIGCATVTGGLSAGANTTISMDWTPTCANYPVMPGFPAQSLPLTINVTVDCNCSNCPTCQDGSCGTITESDETNNIFSKVIPAIQVYSTYNVIGGVVNNGYKSKNFDCDTTEEPLDQFEYYNLIGGGVEYNVSGAKISTFAPQATDSRIHHIGLPSGATVKDARLYVYWQDKWGNYETYPAGCLANLSVNFSGTDLMPDTAYQDSKAFGYYQSPKGNSVFNVTSLLSGSGDYTAVVKNIEPIAGNNTTLLGEMLVVVYEGADHGYDVQIWMLEGTDYLMAADDTHGSYDFSVSPEEATATVAFSGGSINLADVDTAQLITVVAQGMSTGSDLLFNGDVIKTDAWGTSPSSEINVENVSVKSNLLSSGNNMGFQDNGTNGMQASNAILIVKEITSLTDLNVTDVLVNPGNERYEGIVRVYVNQSNNISAVVQNNGPGNIADDFDVCFEADGVKIGCATVTGGLSAGANTTVSMDWTPTCANYPVMPGFPAQSLPLTINVTVDCNCSNCPTCQDGSCGTITESDETNNIFSKVIPAIQVYAGTNGVISGVVNNGYKSKNFDCDTTEEPLDQFEYYNLIGGGVEYNVSGAKISSFDPEATDTRIHHIDLPSGATVKDARLYVYWYDKWYNFNTYPTGCLANLSVNFSGTDLMPDTVYQDSKAFGFYQSPKGSSVFNVTSLISGSGDYTTIVKNIELIGGNGTTLLGEMLVVIYEGADHGHEVQIWMLEGTDYLMAADDTHGSKDFSVSPEEAIATVAFSGGTIDLANVNTARLITVVAQGMELESDMLFNGNVIKTDAWDTATEVSLNSKINVENVSVKSNLLASGNNMGFQDNGTTGMQASNAILIVETPVIVETPLLDLVVSNIYPQYIFTNLTNVLSVNVINQGTATAASCDVNLTITHTGSPTVLTATVPALNAGESAVVEVGNWKPTVLENISITAFADSGGVVDEGANESNNNLTVSRNTTGDCSVDDLLPDTCFGYRGDNPMTTAYEGTGGVIYSVGDFKYKNNTVNFSIGASGDENQIDGLTAKVPTGATIKNATLYVYYTYRKSATGPNPGADPRSDYEMSINGGSTLTTDEYYTDIKGFSTSEYQYGTLVYDVIANVTVDGVYQAVRSNCNNTDPILKGKGYVSGMALMIIYDDGSDNTYAIAHGYDRLATYYKTEYKVLPEDATTTATLTDMDPNLIAIANLLTVTVDAVASGSESQQFNTRSWEVGAWDCVAGVPTCDWNYPLGINRGAVDKSDITASGTDEVVKFQERTSNGFAPVFTCLHTSTPPSPDLVVSNVYPQYIFTNLTNVLSVNVINQGTASAASCDVNLTITHAGGPTVLTATVPALNAGESAMVEVGNWKPTVLENISITAFADSGGVVNEGANEGNNDLTVSRNITGDCAVDDMLPDTCFGYRGDNPMTTAYEGTGGVIYSVGDFKYKNNTVNFTIGASGDENQVDGSTADIPDGATIKNATLYVYFAWRNTATSPNPGADPRPDYEMSINGGGTLTASGYYTDMKGWAGSTSQYGTLVYDVTANVTGDDMYQAVRSNCNNTDLILKKKGFVSGMALMIIYDDGSDATYAIAHGYDRLATFYSTQYKVLPEDATTTATLTDVDPNIIAEDKLKAKVFTVTVDTTDSGTESQQFNSCPWEEGVWIDGSSDYPLGFNRDEVTSCITSSGTDEVVKFQERTSNGFAPVFACLQTAPDTTPTKDDGGNGGGGNGGGGGGASGENFENILISETEREYINKDSKVSYSFDSEGNIVGYINFTGLKGSGRIAAKVEMLSHTSTLVDRAPPDIVYKNLNILVGYLNWATSSNIANPTISFRVEKSWVTEQDIDESTISMSRYSDGKWNLLETTKINEDANYLYFKAVTPGFSPFAVTGKKTSAVEAGEEDIVARPTTLVEETPIQTPGEEKPGIPGFSLFAGLLGLLVTMQLLRKK